MTFNQTDGRTSGDHSGHKADREDKLVLTFQDTNQTEKTS